MNIYIVAGVFYLIMVLIFYVFIRGVSILNEDEEKTETERREESAEAKL